MEPQKSAWSVSYVKMSGQTIRPDAFTVAFDKESTAYNRSENR